MRQQISHMGRQIAEMEADTTWRGTPGEQQTLAQIEQAKVRSQRHR